MATPAQLLKNGSKSEYAGSEDIEKQLEKLSADVANLTKALASFGNGKIDEATSQAKSMAADLSERSALAAADVKGRLVSAESDLEDQIRRYPLAALGIAAGAGFLAAILSRR
jgi:ElaB/YqjD/DUF883 family membrane-anchored ribosome-binding protein